MGNTYTALHCHVVFSTKYREPWLDDSIQERIWSFLAGVAQKNGFKSLQIGGMADHVHLLVGLPSTLALSQAMQRLKGGSSTWIKDAFPRLQGFGWQDGYAAFAVSKSLLPAVEEYIRNQREHHRVTTFQEELRTFLDRHGIAYDERYLWD